MRSSNAPARQRGVTMIELIIVMIIVAILAAVAIPSYRAYVIRTQRSDAKEALLRLATAQEKFYLQNNRYATDDERADAPPAGLGIDASERGWYALEITEPTDVGTATEGFLLTATAVAGGQQATDATCAAFTVNDRGVRTASNAGGSEDTTAECWD